MPSVNSSETPWLQRFTCPRPLREHDQRRPRQAASDESQDIIASAQCILDRENYFVKEVDRYLRHNDFLNLRRKEILYKKWLKNVLEPVLQKIQDKMDSQSINEIRKRTEEQYSLYLNYCKKKVSIPTLQDPLLKDIEKKFTETGIIKQCETGRPYSTRELSRLSKAELPLFPLSRQRMDAIEWLKVPHAYIASDAHRTKRKSPATMKMVKADDVPCPPAACSGQHDHQKILVPRESFCFQMMTDSCWDDSSPE